jgi:hypothetical protein
MAMSIPRMVKQGEIRKGMIKNMHRTIVREPMNWEHETCGVSSPTEKPDDLNASVL